MASGIQMRDFCVDCTGKPEKLKTCRRYFGSPGAPRLPERPAGRETAEPARWALTRRLGKNLLLLAQFSFMIFVTLRTSPEEVIPVYRPLFFTPLKS